MLTALRVATRCAIEATAKTVFCDKIIEECIVGFIAVWNTRIEIARDLRISLLY